MRFLFFALCCFSFFEGYTQVLTSSMDTITSQGEISWNIGYAVYDSYETGSVTLESPLTVDKVISNTSLEEIERGVTIYPNPALNHITLDFDREKISRFLLTNSKGVLLLKEESKKIDMSSYAPGVYYLQFFDDQNQFILNQYKIIKL